MELRDLYGFLNSRSSGLKWDLELSKRIDGENSELFLEQYGYKVYSQNDEDGIIEEIFRRIGTTNKIFIEFGVQDGIESNTHYLIMKDWCGFWIECDAGSYHKIQKKFNTVIANKKLQVVNEYVTVENINSIISESGIEGEIDLLSIDIDGNDYHIWEAIEVVQPRVVVIEYNAKLAPTCEWVMPYNEINIWDGSDRHGASLCALNKLGVNKGYQLVGTNTSGVNAFFVKNELLTGGGQNKFVQSDDVSLYYNPPRYYLQYYSGHPSNYCIKDLSAGINQPFDYNYGRNLVFYNGFFGEEIVGGSYCCWMSSCCAQLLIKPNRFRNKEEILLEYINYYLPLEKEDYLHLKLYLNNHIYCEEDIKETHGMLRILIGKEISEDVCIIELVLNKLWSPMEVLKSSDTRLLGLGIIDNH